MVSYVPSIVDDDELDEEEAAAKLIGQDKKRVHLYDKNGELGSPLQYKVDHPSCTPEAH